MADHKRPPVFGHARIESRQLEQVEHHLVEPSNLVDDDVESLLSAIRKIGPATRWANTTPCAATQTNMHASGAAVKRTNHCRRCTASKYFGSEALAVKTDVTDPDSLQSAIRATVDKFGRLDVLHNNAGGSTAQDDTAVNAPLDEFWRAIKLDLYGTFLGCRFCIPELIKAGGGSVINMSSNVALMGVAGRDCYTAAKGGIAAITRSLAVAYAPQRVRVNAIAPSATMTERVKKLVAGSAALTRLADSHLLGLIEPNDIAGMALYLASDESRMVTGQVLPVDSGVTIS